MTLTSAQRKARAAAIFAESEATGCSIVEAIRRVAPAFSGAKAVAETAPARPAAARVTGTPAKAPRLGKRSKKIAKEAARILAARAVRETLTAAASPKPAPGAAAAQAPERRPAGRQSAGKAPHEMSGDELAAATVAGVGGESPFWRSAAETAPPGAVTETSSSPPKPLHQMSGDELHAYARDRFTARGRAAGFASPTWAG
jgi:hypothetical protein